MNKKLAIVRWTYIILIGIMFSFLVIGHYSIVAKIVDGILLLACMFNVILNAAFNIFVIDHPYFVSLRHIYYYIASLLAAFVALILGKCIWISIVLSFVSLAFITIISDVERRY